MHTKSCLEKIATSGAHTSSRKCGDENETKKEARKYDTCVNILLMEGGHL